MARLSHKQKSVIGAVSGVATSPLFLAAALAETLSFLLSLITLITGAPTSSHTFNEKLVQNGGIDLLQRYPWTAYLTPAAYVLALLLPAGCWMLYFSARKQERPNGLGLTLIRIYVFIPLAFLFLLAGAVLAAFLPMIGEEFWMFLVGLALAGSITVLPILFFILVIKTVNAARRALTSGTNPPLPSQAISVGAFIMGAISLLSAFSNITAAPLAACVSLVNGFAGILWGFVAARYRREIALGKKVKV